MKRLSTVIGSLLLFLSILGIAIGIVYIKYRQIAASMAGGPPPEMPETITVFPVTSVTFRPTTSAVGTVVAPRWVALRNEVSGAVLNLQVTSGSLVEAGMVMIELDKTVEQASLESAAARVKITESTFKRLKLAAKSQATTELEVEQAEAELAQAKAEMSRLQAIIEKKTMRAPFRARAGLINIHPGQFLSEGTEITTLQGIDDYVHVDFMVPQNVADQMKLDQSVAVQVGSECLRARVVAFDSKADRATRNTMVRAELKNPPSILTPNDSVDVEVEYGDEMRAMSVPIAAVRRTPAGAHVFVAEKDASGAMRATLRTIIPGKVLGDRQVILSNLQESDQVIADGSFKLQDGSMIAIQDAGSKKL